MSHDPNPYAPPAAPIAAPSGPVPRAAYPWWVKASLWGVPGRAGLWAFVALCLACAAGFLGYGLWDRRFLPVVPASLFAASMYWLSIRWVDRHGSWAPEA